MSPPTFTFLEFFAGGGMARLGLGEAWTCRFANDLDPRKASAYRTNFGGDHFIEGDVWNLTPQQLPGRPDLAWASSPCQDLSLAGLRGGLTAQRSSAFWGFYRLAEALCEEGRGPRVIVVENVGGLLSSGGGDDFTALCRAFDRLGYRFGALEIDAALWTPQSRPRVFVIAVRDAQGLGAQEPAPPFHSDRLQAAHDRLPRELRAGWVWWPLVAPPRRNTVLADLLEPDDAVDWFTAARTEQLVALMSPLHRSRLEAAGEAGRAVGALYRRVRVESGRKAQRAEVRFDGLAGCLRTPAGGSSRQVVVLAEDGHVRARHLTGREAARLMGLPEDYILPAAETAALKLIGDGVAVPVVRALAEQVIEPLLSGRGRAAA